MCKKKGSISRKLSQKNTTFFERFLSVLGKVHIFWEGHKILRNLHLTFDWHHIGQKWGEDFAKYFGLLRIYKLYNVKIDHALTFGMPKKFYKDWMSLFSIKRVKSFASCWPGQNEDICPSTIKKSMDNRKIDHHLTVHIVHTCILILHREKYKNALNLEITSAVKQGQWGPHTKSIIAVLLVQLVHSYYIITILRKKWL